MSIVETIAAPTTETGLSRRQRAAMLRTRRRELLRLAARELAMAHATWRAADRLPRNDDPIVGEFHSIKRQVYLRMMRSLETAPAVTWGIEQARLAAQQYNTRQKELWAKQKKCWRAGCCGHVSEDQDLAFYHLRDMERLIVKNASAAAILH